MIDDLTPDEREAVASKWAALTLENAQLRRLLLEATGHLAAQIEHASPDAPPEIARYQAKLVERINTALAPKESK